MSNFKSFLNQPGILLVGILLFCSALLFFIQAFPIVCPIAALLFICKHVFWDAKKAKPSRDTSA